MYFQLVGKALFSTTPSIDHQKLFIDASTQCEDDFPDTQLLIDDLKTGYQENISLAKQQMDSVNRESLKLLREEMEKDHNNMMKLLEESLNAAHDENVLSLTKAYDEQVGEVSFCYNKSGANPSSKESKKK